MTSDLVRNHALSAAVIAGMLLVSSADGAERLSKPIDVGSARQLLFDDLLLEASSGVTLRVNRPIQDREPVLVAD